MLKAFFKDSFVYGIGNFLVRGISFILLPVYTRYFSVEEYGILELYLIIASLFNVLSSFEISQGLARFYPMAHSQTEKKAYASTALWFSLLTSFTCLLLIFLVLDCLDRNFLDLNIHQLLSNKIVLLSLLGNAILYLLQNQLRWRLQAHYFILISLIFSLSTACTTLTLVVGYHQGYQSVFWGNLIGSIVSCLLTFHLSKNDYSFSFDSEKLKEMLKFSLPLIPASLGVLFSLYTDRVLIKEMLPLEDLGFFAVAYRFASIATLFTYCFQVALTPLIYNNYQDQNTQAQVAILFRLFCLLGFSVVFGLFVFEQELISIFATKAYSKSSNLIFLIATSLFVSNFYLFFPGLMIANKTKYISYINLAGAIINIILNYIFIRYLGLIGSVIATLVSSIMVAILTCKLSLNYYHAVYGKLKLLSYLGLLIVCFILGSLIKAYSALPEKIMLSTVLYFLVLLISVKILLGKNFKSWNHLKRPLEHNVSD